MSADELHHRISLSLDGALDPGDEATLAADLAADPAAAAFRDELLALRARLRSPEPPTPDVAGRVRAALRAEDARDVRTIPLVPSSPASKRSDGQEPEMQQTPDTEVVELDRHDRDELAPRRNRRRASRWTALVAAAAAAVLVVGVVAAVRDDEPQRATRPVEVPPLSAQDVADLKAAFEQLSAVFFDGQAEITPEKLATIDSPSDPFVAYVKQLAQTYSTYYVAMQPVIDDAVASGENQARVTFHIRDVANNVEKWVSPLAPKGYDDGQYSLTAVKVDGAWRYTAASICDDMLYAFGVPCPFEVRYPEAAGALDTPEGRAIKAALDQLFDLNRPVEERLAAVEGGEAFADVAGAAADLVAQFNAKPRLLGVVVDGQDRVTIGLDITSDTTTLPTLTGTAVRLDGQWRIGHRTACELFAAVDGTLTCDAEPGTTWADEPAPRGNLRGMAPLVQVELAPGADRTEIERLVATVLDPNAPLDAKRPLLGTIVTVPVAVEEAPDGRRYSSEFRAATDEEIAALLAALNGALEGWTYSVDGIVVDKGSAAPQTARVDLTFRKGSTTAGAGIAVTRDVSGSSAAWVLSPFDGCNLTAMLGGTCPPPFDDLFAGLVVN